MADFDKIKDVLGDPYFESNEVLLFHGDCLELMSELKGQEFPLTVTSPPYNIGKEYEEIQHMQDYIDWSERWIKAIYSLTSAQGAFWLNLGYVPLEGKAKAIPLPYLLWDRIPFYLIQEIIWNYGAGVAGKKFLSPRNEKFLWYVKNSENYVFNLDDIRDPDVKYPNQKKNGRLKCNPLGKNPTDVWQVPKVTSGRNRSSKERTDHPAQFPVELISRIIKASTNKGDVVLDPFMGSGSTAVAALKNGRKAVGFEIRKDYLDIAAERIENEYFSIPSSIGTLRNIKTSRLVKSDQFELC